MKKIIEFILGTFILWLPILFCLIADWLTKIITINMIIKAVYISIPVSIFAIIKMNIEEAKEERRYKKYAKM